MNYKHFLVLVLCVLHLAVSAQKSLLQSGPMLGYSEMKEVLLWVQTKEAATVHFAYWPQGQTDNIAYTGKKQTSKNQAFVAKLIADQVEPGQRYDYDLYINDQKIELDYPTTFQTQTLWQWRTDPPDFTIALGSCLYINEPKYDRPGTPYGGEYEILESIHKMRPDAMLWLGDNTYLREVDWFSKTGIQHRYTHSRSVKEMQALLASTHHYAIWDDHDFGPNNSDRSFFHKDKTKAAFELFWGNPSYGLPQLSEPNQGITSYFQWGDIDFFLLDNRYYRNSNYLKVGKKTMLGEEQLDWLLNALAKSQAPFKMVAIGGQVLNTSKTDETYINHFEEERAYLLRRIREEGIKNVVFLDGDRHHTELSQESLARDQMIYDLTVSPLTSGTGRNVEKDNTNRVNGTLINQRNFGLLAFSGPQRERKMKITIYDGKGAELWTRTIESQ
ncbi:MAG: alkaline phosphatase D family protein [Bacteroidota bacterium]